MAIETASTLSGMVATIPATGTNLSAIILFMAFKPLNTLTATWDRGVSLGVPSIAIPYVRMRLRADSGVEGLARNASNSGHDITAAVGPSLNTWHRVAIRLRPAIRMGIRAQGDSVLSQSAVADGTPFPGSDMTRFRINTNFDYTVFGEAGRYAQFGYFLGDWSDQLIADFAAGLFNPANSNQVTTYWTGDSFAPQIGTGTLAQAGSNNAFIVADAGHGVPDFTGGGGGILLSQVERGRVFGRGFARGMQP
jgi:hypothetical protein